jgi:hypothetical protein
MIEWYDKLYTDEKSKKNLDKYRKILENQKMKLPPLYCVTLASNKRNLFDIISCNELWFDYYRKNHIFVIGLASNYRNALKLLQEMVLDMYEQSGGLKAEQYFK